MEKKQKIDDESIRKEIAEKVTVKDFPPGTDPLAVPVETVNPYLCDSSSIITVTAAGDAKQAKRQSKTLNLFERACKAVTGEAEIMKLIDEGKELARTLVGEANLQLNAALMNFAIMAIMIGGLLNKLKELVTRLGFDWAIWSNNNIQFIKVRNRQKFMRIASRPDCHELAYLGVDRLDHVCSITKKSDGPEPIKQLFSKYGIDPDPAEEASLEQFKLNVDGAIICERLEKRGVVLPLEKIKEVIKKGHLDSAYINSLVEIKKAGGDPAIKVDNDLQGTSDKSDDEAMQSSADFNSLAVKLRDVIDYITQEDNEEAISTIDINILNELEKRIQELKARAGIVPVA